MKAPRMNQDKWTFYLDRNREWRWTRNSFSNGKIVGTSSEGFSSKTNCIANAKRNGYFRK
jgi:uncharacterized protein YegP (UPF0339 family)